MPHSYATPSNPYSRHRTIHPHGGRLQRCRTHREKQPIYRRNVIGSACTSDRRHSSEPPIDSCIEDIDEALTAAGINAPALCVHENIVGIAAQLDTRETLSIAGGEDSQFCRTTEGHQDALSILVERHRKIPTSTLHRPRCLLLTAGAVQH